MEKIKEQELIASDFNILDFQPFANLAGEEIGDFRVARHGLLASISEFATGNGPRA